MVNIILSLATLIVYMSEGCTECGCISMKCLHTIESFNMALMAMGLIMWSGLSM